MGLSLRTILQSGITAWAVHVIRRPRGVIESGGSDTRMMRWGISSRKPAAKTAVAVATAAVMRKNLCFMMSRLSLSGH